MKTLTDDDLGHLGSFERGVYSAILEPVLRSIDMAILDESSGFELVLDECNDAPDPYFVRFRFQYNDQLHPFLSGVFGDFPKDVTAFVHTEARRFRWAASPGAERSVGDCVSESRRFFEDLFAGELSLVTHARGSTPYKWELVRGDEVLSSERRVVYPYWAKKRTTVRRLLFTSTSEKNVVETRANEE